jgi:ABC-type uncharacterized transport system substrate-binding protein
MKYPLILTIAVTLLLGLTSIGHSQQRILVVHSYHAGFDWVDQINLGIKRALPSEGIDIQTYYMDTKRRTDESWKAQAGHKALTLCHEFKPQVVIACDDNAQAYFASHLSRQPDSPKIVFCGVNGQLKDYGYPNEHVTGILERPHFTNTLRLAKSLSPKIQRVTILTDKSLTSEQNIAYAQTLNMPVKIVRYASAENLQQWLTIVQQANQDSDAIMVLTYHTVKNTSLDSDSMEPSKVMQATVRLSQVPILGIYPFAVDDGAVLAISASPMEHGYLSARIAQDLMRSQIKPSQIEINKAVEGMILFNLPAAKKFNITIPPHLMKMSQGIINEYGQQALKSQR